MKATKRIFSLILALVLCFGLCACGAEKRDGPSNNDNKTATLYSVGDTVCSDILQFTLDEATLAIALSNAVDNNYCSPKVFDAQKDANNPLVCGKGHTYAAFTYTIENLDRTNFNGRLPFVSAKYQGETSNKQVDGAQYIKSTNEWRTTGNNPTSPVYSWHFVLKVGETKTYRSFIDIPVEATDLTDEFELIVELPNSSGSTDSFTYLVK